MAYGGLALLNAGDGERLRVVPVGGGERVGGGCHGGLGDVTAGSRDGDVAGRRTVHDDRVGLCGTLSGDQRGGGDGQRGRGGCRCPDRRGKHGDHQRHDQERDAWGLCYPRHVLTDRVAI